MERLSRELAEEFVDGLITEFREGMGHELNGLNWAVTKAIMLMRIEGMPIEDVMNSDLLGRMAMQTINEAVIAHHRVELDAALLKLLDEDCIELVSMPNGSIGYRWKE